MKAFARLFVMVLSYTLVYAAVMIAAAYLSRVNRAQGAEIESSITRHERAACIADARKYCPDELASKDIQAGIACMIRNKSRLSPACQKVLTDHGM